MIDKSLQELIDRYFSADTSLEEEQVLLNILLNYPQGNREIDSVLAVMGYAKVRSKGKLKKKRFKKHIIKKHIIVLTACVASIVLGVTFMTLYSDFSNKMTSSHCIAYVDGKQVKECMEVIKLMDMQFGEFGEVAEDLDREIGNDLMDFKKLLSDE